MERVKKLENSTEESFGIRGGGMQERYGPELERPYLPPEKR